MSSLNSEASFNSLFPTFHPSLHPFLRYSLTCLIAIFNYSYFQRPLHSQCCPVSPAVLVVDPQCPGIGMGRWREPGFCIKVSLRRSVCAHHCWLALETQQWSRLDRAMASHHSYLRRSWCSATGERNATWLIELGFLIKIKCKYSAPNRL